MFSWQIVPPYSAGPERDYNGCVGQQIPESLPERRPGPLSGIL